MCRFSSSVGTTHWIDDPMATLAINDQPTSAKRPSQVEMMRAFSRDAGARGWKLPHAPEHEQGTHYFQSPYNDAVCFSCSATGEWDDMLRANSKKLRSLQREAEAVAYAAERKDLRCQLEATQALTVQMAAEHAETQIQRARMDPSVL